MGLIYQVRHSLVGKNDAPKHRQTFKLILYDLGQYASSRKFPDARDGSA
jgi:hypothetical protein